ncbi:MAG: type II secretion system F family protein [Planctomycetota bacterium]
MLSPIAAHERAALHFDDLASAFDAGLPLLSQGAKPDSDERVVHQLLRDRGVVLSTTEDAVLLAAWRAGRIGAALRGRAEERRHRAEFLKSIWVGLRYPLVLMGMIVLASFATAGIIGHYWYAVIALGIVVALPVAFLLIRRGLLHGHDRWTRVPMLGSIGTGLGELPYLETLQALYGAGVPLNQAHAAAVAVVPVASMQRRLQVADRALQGGTSLTESLGQALALHSETRMLITTGEHAGQLEDALQRALKRRRDTASRELTFVARRVGNLAYGLAVVLVFLMVYNFYSNYFGMMRR